MPISFPQATLGGEIEVPTLDGKTKLKIPAGTQSGKVFNLKSKGAPSLRTGRRGDQMIVVNIETPAKLNKRQRELIEELGENKQRRIVPAKEKFSGQGKGAIRVMLPPFPKGLGPVGLSIATGSGGLMKRCALSVAAALFMAVLIDAAPVFSAGPEVNADKVTIDPAKAGAEMREALDSIKRAGPSDENMLRLEKAIEAGPVRLDATALSDIAAAYAKRGDCRNALQYYEKLLTVLAAPHAKGKTEALYGAAYCRYKLGDMTAAKTGLEAITENPLAMAAEKTKAVALSNEIESVLNAAKGTKPKFVVGALLPLNGQYARFGEAALKGMLLAADVFGRPSAGDSIEIAVKDTSKEGAPIEDLVDELLEKQEIAGIIGPLMGAEATEASAIIQTRGIPAIMLSQKKV